VTLTSSGRFRFSGRAVSRQVWLARGIFNSLILTPGA
jgi:hypothetical protein